MATPCVETGSRPTCADGSSRSPSALGIHLDMPLTNRFNESLAPRMAIQHP